MAQRGLLGYALPQWEVAQWEQLSPQTMGALTANETQLVYALYAGLRAITAVYDKLVTIPPEEMKTYTQGGSGERFWYNYFAPAHVVYFVRLDQLVRHILDGGNPLERPTS